MDRRSHCGNSFSLVVLSDTVECKLVDLSGQSTYESGLDYPRAFHSNADGYVTIEGAGNIAGKTVVINVINGLSYSYGAKKFMSTGSCLGTGSLIAIR